MSAGSSDHAALVLGIETSCDETAAAVVTREGRVLSSVVSSQVPIHARYGGVVPELASRNHLVQAPPVIAQAMAEAGIGLDALGAVAVTAGPGLAGCLLIGMQVGKSMAYARGVPLVPVDHIQAHVWAPFLSDARDAGAATRGLAYPYIALAVSGGHTSLLKVDGPGVSTTLGATMDDAAGECFDKIAKLMGLPYPGGAHIDRLAKIGDATRFDLPRPLAHKGLDFSFSGLKTAARLAWAAASAGLDEGPALDAVRADLAASAQAAIVDVLVDKAFLACRETGIARLVAAGGVACNEGLRARLADKAPRRKIAVHVAPARYCSDNAAMVGGLGAALWQGGAGLTGRELTRAGIYVTSRRAVYAAVGGAAKAGARARSEAR